VSVSLDQGNFLNTSLFQLRKLRYRRLSRLIGRNLTIQSLSHVETAVLAVTEKVLPDVRFELQDSIDHLVGVMGKLVAGKFNTIVSTSPGMAVLANLPGLAEQARRAAGPRCLGLHQFPANDRRIPTLSHPRRW
jgi:hypothetical protein